MNTHAIITYSKIHYLLTKEKHDELLDKTLDDVLMVDGNAVKIRNIADVLTMQKYYEVYPDKRPQYVDRYKELPGMGFEGIIKSAPGAAIKGMIKGMKNFLSDKKLGECPNAEDLLEKMELKNKMQI